jgi:hypothetical protein
VQGAEVLGEFQRQMQSRLTARPALASAIARSRVEEPIVLQKPTTAAALNAAIADALGLGTIPDIKIRAPSAEIAEGREERIR